MSVYRPATQAITDEDLRDTLAAPVRDPLWTLARQWQLGEFIAEDGGAAATVQISWATAPLRSQGSDDRAVTGPLEAFIQQDYPPPIGDLPVGRLVRIAMEFCRRLDDSGLGRLRSLFASMHPIAFDHDTPLARRWAGRLPDPRSLHAAWSSVDLEQPDGPFPEIPGVPAADVRAVEDVARGWLRWLFPQARPDGLGLPAGPPSWAAYRLHYRAELNAFTQHHDVVLEAADHHGERLDWYAFDAHRVLNPAVGRPADAVTAPPVQSQMVLPAPARYRGMPRPRYWDLEDGDVNLDLLTHQDDTATSLLVAFAHQYSNDWFIVPVPGEAGLRQLVALTIVDTFGIPTPVEPIARLDGPDSGFRLWAASGTSDATEATDACLLVTPSAGVTLDSEAREETLFVRDELANLAWAVDLKTRDRDGKLVDRLQRWVSLRPSTDPNFNTGRGIGLLYRLGTTVPDFWYPFEATETPEPRNNEQTIATLTMATLPPAARPVDDANVRGLLTSQRTDVLEDHEVPRIGARVRRIERLCRWMDQTYSWTALVTSPGEGEASSGLRFDVVEALSEP